MKKQFELLVLLLASSVALSTSALAYDAWYAGPHAGVSYGGYGYGSYGYHPYGYGGYGYGGYGAQTPFSANANGMSNLVRAEGQAHQANAQAMISYEKARGEYIDNQQKVHYAMAQRKRESQAQDAKDLEAAQAAQVRGDEFLAAHRQPPLSSAQLNPSTGGIQWPETLKSADFADLRKSLESSFETRSKTGSTADLSLQIEMQIGQMKDLLRSQITQMPMPEYSASRKFLDRMAVSVKSSND